MKAINVLRKVFVVIMTCIIIPFMYWGMYTAPNFNLENMLSIQPIQALIQTLGFLGYCIGIGAFIGLLILPAGGYAYFAYEIWPKKPKK